MCAASMAPADARVSESMTKKSTRAFSLARCSNSIRSGVQSETCWNTPEKNEKIRNVLTMGPDNLPDCKTKCPNPLKLEWQHPPSMWSDYRNPPKILPVRLHRFCHPNHNRQMTLRCQPPMEFHHSSNAVHFAFEIASNRRPAHKTRQTSNHFVACSNWCRHQSYCCRDVQTVLLFVSCH